jgi:hypothetical protein
MYAEVFWCQPPLLTLEKASPSVMPRGRGMRDFRHAGSRRRPFCRIAYSGSVLLSLTLPDQLSVPDDARGLQGL